MCSVALKVEVLFISVTIAVSALCCNCSLWYKMQFPKLLYTSFIVSGCVVGYVKNVEVVIFVVVAVHFVHIGEYSKTGDFILDLYWPGCRCDWPSTNTWLTRMSLVQLTEPWPHILYWMCLCYTLAVWLGNILNARNIVPNLEWTNTFTGSGTIQKFGLPWPCPLNCCGPRPKPQPLYVFIWFPSKYGLCELPYHVGFCCGALL